MADESANFCFDKSGAKVDDVPQSHINRIFNEMLQRRLHSRCATSANTCPRLTPPQWTRQPRCNHRLLSERITVERDADFVRRQTQECIESRAVARMVPLLNRSRQAIAERFGCPAPQLHGKPEH